MIKKISTVLLVVLVAIQFFQPKKNIAEGQGPDMHHISQKYTIPNEVDMLLKSACYDCHSNNTRYPWYANIQPFAWFLNNHVVDGKRHLNFSEFTNLPIARQNHKFEETIEMIEQNEMPLASYTSFGLHQDARLSAAQRTLLVSWARSQMQLLKSNYPADSLVMKKRK